jgi:hypothetical protein
MNTLNPQIVQVLSVAVGAAAMLVLGRSKGMLEERQPKRCAACGRLTEAKRRCAHCG